MVPGKRIFGYDLLKALAAFFVVLYHVDLVHLVDLGYREGVYYYPSFIQILGLFCACGVPLFLMVNGALTVGKRYDLKKTTVKVGRLLFVGIFWGVIAMCVKAYCKQDMSCFSPKMLLYYWFLYTLAMMYVVNYLLGIAPRWCRWVVVGALLIIPFTTNLFWDMVMLINPDISLPAWGHVGLFTLYGLVYLYAGDFFAHHDSRKWVIWLCGIVGLSLLALEATAVVNYMHRAFEGGNYCFPTWGALLLSIALFSGLKDSEIHVPWIREFVEFLGNNVLGIYIIHFLLMLILGRFLHFSFGNIHLVFVIMIAIGFMVVSAVVSELLRRTPLAFLLKL